MKKQNPIYVTQPALPPLEEFVLYLQKIWDNKTLTDGGSFMWVAALLPAVIAVQWPTNAAALVLVLGLAVCALLYSGVYARLKQLRWCISAATPLLPNPQINWVAE